MTVEYASTNATSDVLTKVIAFRPENMGVGTPDYGVIHLQVVDKGTATKIDEFVSAYYCYSPGICLDSTRTTPLTIAEVPARKILNFGGPVSSEAVAFIKGNKAVIFSINYDGTDDEPIPNSENKTPEDLQNQKIFNQMLDSFTLLE